MLSRYIIVGSVATAIFYLVANVVSWLVNDYIATFFGNLVSFVFGYFAQMRYAFNTQAKHRVMIPRYCILLCLIFMYGQCITFIGRDFSYYFVSFFIALSVPFFSYPLQKFWVFKNTKSSSDSILGGGVNKLPYTESLFKSLVFVTFRIFLIFHYPQTHAISLYLKNKECL